MAKIFDWSIQNGAICICFFVKWQILLWVTFQASKSNTFPQQHHTLKSSTVWILSLVVRWRTHRKTRTLPRKIPKNITEAERSSSSVAIIWVRVPLRSIKYRKFDQNWSYRHKMSLMLFSFLIKSPQATQDSHKCTLTIFLQTPSDRTIAHKRVKEGDVITFYSFLTYGPLNMHEMYMKIRLH